MNAVIALGNPSTDEKKLRKLLHLHYTVWQSDSMRLIVLLVFLFSGCAEKSQTTYNEDEIIFVVELKPVSGKNSEDISNFSKVYTDAIDNNEPESLGWGFYESDGKVTLIERYQSSDAVLTHVQNVSEGGKLEGLFGEFLGYFEIAKIEIFGTASPELKAVLKSMDMPASYRSAMASFSRSK